MLTSQRRRHIMDVLGRDGQVVARELSEALGVSEDTIRRDLRDLAGDGLIQRVHGGALPASPAVADLPARRSIATDTKARIGRAAAGLIRPGQVVILDGGTTTAQVVRALPRDLRATVITHSPTIAVDLQDHPGIEVVLLGGRLYRHSMVAVGALAVEAAAGIRADLFLLGVTGAHPDEGFTTGDIEEAAIKRALSARAAETVVLASSEKLGAASPFRVLGLAQVSGMVVERETPAATLAPFERAGLDIITA